MLHKIDEFLCNIEPCIESITGDERDLTTFMRLMRIFNEVSVPDAPLVSCQLIS